MITETIFGSEPVEAPHEHQTTENVIQFRPRPKPQPRMMSQMIGVPSFTFDGFDPRDPDPA